MKKNQNAILMCTNKEQYKKYSKDYLCFLRMGVFCKSGIEADYFKMSKDCGVKLFSLKQSAFHSHKLQNKFSKMNMAPHVLSKVLPINIVGPIEGNDPPFKHYWGYFTQHVTILGDIYQEVSEKTVTNYCTQIKKILDFLYEKHSISYDDHFDNFGIMERKVILVDFGPYSSESFENE